MPRAWDPTDDAPADELLRQAGLPDKTFELRVRTLFNALRAADGDGVGVSAFSALLTQLGVPAGACEHIHRAICRRSDGVLDWESVLLGICAMDPLCPHAGVWNGIRAQYIFRR